MRTFEERRRIVLPAPITEVFSFFETPANLAKITPPSLAFRMLTPEPIVMKAGAVFDYRLRPLGIPMRWQTLITEYDPPHRFVDVQLKGPYSVWHHTHTFEPVAGGTAMEDIVRYVLRFGRLGLLAQPFVRRDLHRIFAFREEAIRRIFR